MQLPGEQWWMRGKNLVKSIAQTCQEGQRGQNCQISVWSSCGAGFGFCPHQRQIKNNEEYKKWVKLTYYTFFANRVSPFFKLSTKFRENWLTNMCKRSLYTCLSRPLKSPIFCHLTWQLDKSQNWESLPTLCASEISRLICDFIKSFGFMSKILPNFRGKSKLLTFLLSSANIGNFFHSIQSWTWKIYPFSFHLGALPKLVCTPKCAKTAFKVGKETQIGVDGCLPPHFSASQRFPIGSSTWR